MRTEDQEFPASLPLNETRWVISTIRDRSVNLVLLEVLQRQGYRGESALTAPTPEAAGILEEAGVDLVLRPFADAAERAVEELTGSTPSR